MNKQRLIGRLALVIGLGAIASASAGCYSRVVDAKGIGADQRHPKQSEATQPVRARDFWSKSEDEK